MIGGKSRTKYLNKQTNKHIQSAKTSKQRVFGPSWRGDGRWKLAKAGSWWRRQQPSYVCAKEWVRQNQPWPVCTQNSGGCRRGKKICECWVFTVTTHERIWRLLLLLLVKKQSSSFVWNSQGAVLYAHRSERLWFADCRRIFYFSKKKRHVKRKKQLAQIIKTHNTAHI